LKRLFRNKGLQIAVFLSLLAVAGRFLNAQANTGSISGTVTDPTGAAIAGATATITNQATAVSHAATTDSSGFYSAEGLSVGQYKVAISKPGFKENLTNGIGRQRDV